MIKILIVDDSPVETAILKNILDAESDMEVIACAKDGKQGVELASKLKPDLITMDIQMPVMDGYEATRLIMLQSPAPIVVISSKANIKTMDITFLALEAGALTVIAKPFNITAPTFELERKNIIDTIRNMAEIKVIKRRFNTQALQKNHIKTLNKNYQANDYEIIAIGASVGGPEVLKTILAKFPKNFPLPIVVVQHMAQGFIAGFTEWLNNFCLLHVKEAKDNELLQLGTVYFAPDNYHLEVNRKNGQLVAKLVKGPTVSGFCPSVNTLLDSVAKTCNKRAIGMLLTGMGNDGAQGLLELKKVHGHTLIQDAKSTVVFGMGGVAQSLGAVDKVIELNHIADYLINLVTAKARPSTEKT